MMAIPDRSWLRPLSRALVTFWSDVVLPVLAFAAFVMLWLVAGVPMAQALIAFYIDASQQDQMTLLGLVGLLVLVGVLLHVIVRRTSRRRSVGRDGVPTAALGRMEFAGDSSRGVPEQLRDAWRTARTRYGARYAQWVIARVGLNATPAEVREYAAAHHEQWVQATSIDLDLERRARHEAAHAVVAHALGCTVTKADVLVDDSVGGAVHFELPVPVLPDHEAAWVSMRATLAGRTIDYSRGEHDRGASSDVQRALLHAAVIVSAGLRPTGYSGGLTTDELLAAASDDAHRILTAHADVVEDITGALVTHTVLGSHDLRAIWIKAVDREAVNADLIGQRSGGTATAQREEGSAR